MPPAPFLVIGSGGRLGRAIVEALEAALRPVLGWDRHTVDLTDTHALWERLEDTDYSNVIITAAMTSVDACEKEPERAFAVNAEAPAIIATNATSRGLRCLYVSTDYVYDGTTPVLKTEACPLNPLGVYAKTKQQGESGVLQVSENHLVARTSWIFGPQRPSFVDQLLQQARCGEPLKAIADKFSAPSYSNDLAMLMVELLDHPQAKGIYNVVNAAAADVSWHTLANEALDQAAANRSLPLRPPVQPISIKDMHGFLAPRPIHTTPDTSKLSALLNRPIPTWQDALARYLGLKS